MGSSGLAGSGVKAVVWSHLNPQDEVIGIGNFGLGENEVLIRDTAAGQFYLRTVEQDGLSLKPKQRFLPLIDLTSDYTALGDFNGDGITDLLIKNENERGANIHFFSEGRIIAKGPLDAGSAVGAINGLTPAFVGHFNGDKITDVIWHNPVSEKYVIGLGASGGLFHYKKLKSDYGDRLTGVGDVNKDGLADLIWHNDQFDSYHIHAWAGNGRFKPWGDLSRLTGQGLELVGVGDFNGDGYNDILWNHRLDYAVDASPYGVSRKWALTSFVSITVYEEDPAADLEEALLEILDGAMPGEGEWKVNTTDLNRDGVTEIIFVPAS